MKTYRCSKCKNKKPASEMRKDNKRTKNDGISSQCNDCYKELYGEKAKARRKEYGKTHRRELVEKQKQYYAEHKESTQEYRKIYYTKSKLIALEHYGTKCACCGESNPTFLAIDHIGGGGTKHRKTMSKGGVNIYDWLRKNNYPPGFRTLCHNCNWATAFGRTCPHQLTPS